jgi:LmbE family N-acetylglucosaminyl deacetylase
MQRLMAIFAHPDDEGMVGGTLARCADWGVEVQLVCATRGEAGEISDPSLGTSEILGEVRQQELIDACEILGVDRIGFLDYRDSGMVDTPENADPRAFVQANEEEAIGRIVAFIRAWQPDVVITFEPFGWYGHPDHIAASRLATAAFHAAVDDSKFAEYGAPWQADALYYAVMPMSRLAEMIAGAQAQGIDVGEFGRNPREEQLAAEAQVTHKLDVRPYVNRRLAAMLAHKTQFGADSLFRRLPRDLVDSFMGYDYLIQVVPEGAAEKGVVSAELKPI